MDSSKAFFRKKTLVLAACLSLFALVNAASARYVGFNFASALAEIPSSMVWFLTEFCPSVESLENLGDILPALGSTVLVSVASSCLAAVLSLAFAVAGSRAVGIGGPAALLVRGVASVFRNIPVVAWALILLFSFKQSEFTGFLALFLTSFGYLTRCYLETLDEMPQGPLEALRAAGATPLQVVAQAVLPTVSTTAISWVLYMIETNIRDATLVGILTGTGIGFVFDVYYKSFQYDAAGLTILAIVALVILCEGVSNFVRRKII